MLPKFANGGTLPTAAGLGAGGLRGDELGEVLAHVGGDGGARAVEVEAASQFVGQQGEVEWLRVRQKFGQEGVGRGWPSRPMIAAGRLRTEGPMVLQPLVPQLVKAGLGELQPLSGGGGIQAALVEGRQDFLHIKRWNTVR